MPCVGTVNLRALYITSWTDRFAGFTFHGKLDFVTFDLDLVDNELIRV